MKTTLKIGLASLLVVAGVAVSYGQGAGDVPSVYGSGASQELLWTFDTYNQGWGPNGTPTMNATWNSGVQSTISSPSGISADITLSASLGPSATWARAQQGYYASASVISQSVNYSEFTFDYMLPASTPLDTSSALPQMVVWMQWGTTGNTDNNGNNVPYDVALTADGNWHNVTIAASSSLDGVANGGNGISFSNWSYLHIVTLGLSDNNYTSATALTVDVDNVGFAGPVPEPATLALCGLGGLMGLFLVRRKS